MAHEIICFSCFCKVVCNQGSIVANYYVITRVRCAYLPFKSCLSESPWHIGKGMLLISALLIIVQFFFFPQLDVRGDPYGLLAAHPVAPLVSLHHLVSAKPLFPGENQLDSIKRLLHAYHVDPGRIIQQSFCYDHRHKWSVSISWGYTAQLYPSLIPAKVLSMPLQTFDTWRSGSDGPFVFNTRPMKEDPCERPIIYYLDQVKDIGEGKTVSTYTRPSGDDGKECPQPAYKLAMLLKKLTVSASKTGPEKWMKVCFLTPIL